MAGRAPRTTSATAGATSAGASKAGARAPYRVLIVEARFNERIADEMARGAIEEIEARGGTWERVAVPGALEIPLVVAGAVRNGLFPDGKKAGRFDGVVALGCVIRGETYHFEVVSNNANHWLMDVAVKHGVPVGNGILTVDTDFQAIERATGGRDGKGGDAARACLRVIDLYRLQAGQDITS